MLQFPFQIFEIEFDTTFLHPKTNFEFYVDIYLLIWEPKLSPKKYFYLIWEPKLPPQNIFLLNLGTQIKITYFQKPKNKKKMETNK